MPPWSTTATSIPNGNTGTMRTLAEMSRLAQAGARDPNVIAVAHEIVRTVRERDDLATMRALLAYVRARMRYTPDPIDVELVKSPQAMIGESRASMTGKFVGDCDDASVLLAALLGAVGLFSRFCVIAADGQRRGEWSHVYVSARTSSGEWVPLDPIVRGYDVGEEAPSSALSGPRAYFPGAAGIGALDMMRTRSAHWHRGMNGLGASPADMWSQFADERAAKGYEGSADADFAVFTGGKTAPGNSTIDPTIAAILNTAGQVASAVVNRNATQQRPGQQQRPGSAFSQPLVVQAPAPAGGMSTTTKVLIGAGALLAAVLVVKAMRR